MYPRTQEAMKLLTQNSQSRKENLLDIPLIKRDELNETRIFDEAKNIQNILEVKLSTRYQKIQRQPNKQRTQFMVSLLSKDINMTKLRAGLDLVILVDVSSSMSRTKIELAQETLMFVIDQLEEIDRLCIIKFSDDSTILSPLVPMTGEGKAKFKNIVLTKLQCSGNTNIKAGLADCFEVLQARRERNEVTSIFLLSDGSDTAGNSFESFRAYIDKMEQQLTPKGIDFQINCFGYGVDHDEELLTLLAKKQQGFFYYIKDLKRIDECFIDCLSKLMSIYAKNVQIDVFLNGGITFAKLYGPFWQGSQVNGAKGTLNIKTLKSGSELNFLAEIDIPPLGFDTVLKVAVAVLNYTDGNTSCVISKELRLEVVEGVGLGPLNAQLDGLMLKFEAAELFEKAEAKGWGKKEEVDKLVSDFEEKLVFRRCENPAIATTFGAVPVREIVKFKKVSNQARYVFENQQDSAPGFECLFSAPSANYQKRSMMAKK